VVEEITIQADVKIVDSAEIYFVLTLINGEGDCPLVIKDVLNGLFKLWHSYSLIRPDRLGSSGPLSVKSPP